MPAHPPPLLTRIAELEAENVVLKNGLKIAQQMHEYRMRQFSSIVFVPWPEDDEDE